MAVDQAGDQAAKLLVLVKEPKGFALAKAFVHGLWKDDESFAVAHAVDIVAALQQAHDSDGPHPHQHLPVCALVLDVACDRTRSAPGASAAVRSRALDVGLRSPGLLRKLCRLTGEVAPPETALAAVDRLLAMPRPSWKEAALLAVDAGLGDEALGHRVAPLLSGLVDSGEHRSAEVFAATAPRRAGLLALYGERADHKQVANLVRRWRLRPRTPYEASFLALEGSRVRWLLRGGHLHLLTGLVRELAQRLSAWAPDAVAAPAIPQDFEDDAEAWPLTREGTARLLGSTLSACVHADVSGGHARDVATEVVRWLGDEARSWWGAEIAQLEAASSRTTLLAASPAADATTAGSLPWLELPPAYRLETVDDDEGLSAMARELAGVDLVGLDSEWCAGSFLRTPRSSLLQLATDAVCFFVDLPALLRDEAQRRRTDRVLSHVLHRDRPVVLAFGLALELSTLSQSYPTVHAFDPAEARGAICMQRAAQRALGTARASRVGLAAACEETLGARLRKDMTLSDWNRRPLNDAQRCYAARDAWCLLLLHERLVATTAGQRESRGRAPVPVCAVESAPHV